MSHDLQCECVPVNRDEVLTDSMACPALRPDFICLSGRGVVDYEAYNRILLSFSFRYHYTFYKNYNSSWLQTRIRLMAS